MVEGMLVGMGAKVREHSKGENESKRDSFTLSLFADL
jgi:hypothetical protein